MTSPEYRDCLPTTGQQVESPDLFFFSRLVCFPRLLSLLVPLGLSWSSWNGSPHYELQFLTTNRFLLRFSFSFWSTRTLYGVQVILRTEYSHRVYRGLGVHTHVVPSLPRWFPRISVLLLLLSCFLDYVHAFFAPLTSTGDSAYSELGKSSNSLYTLSYTGRRF